MLKGDDIKRLIKSVENWQVEFKLAKGGVFKTFEVHSASFKTADGMFRSHH